MKNGYKIHSSGFRVLVNKYLSSFLLITVYFLLFTPLAYAHKVNIYAYAEDGMVYSESYFVDGSKCKNSILEVFDEKDKTKLLEGKTDDEGKFSFKIPKATSLKLVLHASMGHQAEFIIGEDEVREAMGIKIQKSEVRSQKSEKEVKKVRSLEEEKASELEAIVESAVEKKLQPVMRTLVKIQENSGKPSFTEIIGGIGYIIGILGIIAYFKAKNEIKKRT